MGYTWFPIGFEERNGDGDEAGLGDCMLGLPSSDTWLCGLEVVLQKRTKEKMFGPLKWLGGVSSPMSLLCQPFSFFWTSGGVRRSDSAAAALIHLPVVCSSCGKGPVNPEETLPGHLVLCNLSYLQIGQLSCCRCCRSRVQITFGQREGAGTMRAPRVSCLRDLAVQVGNGYRDA